MMPLRECPFAALFVVHQRYPSAGDAEVVVRIVSADLYPGRIPFSEIIFFICQHSFYMSEGKMKARIVV